MTDAATVRPSEFLRLIYGDEPLTGRVVLWRGDTKQAVGITDDRLAEADALAQRCRETAGAELYYGVCLQGDEWVSGRGTAATVGAMPGVWVDLDLAHGARRKKSLRNYPNREAADEIIKRLPRQPTLIVDTGGGWHVYWLFHGPAVLGTEAERLKAASIVAGWQRMVAAEMQRAGGYELDPTQDLARVLRPVGTWSHRWERPVGFVDGWGTPLFRYYPDDIEAFTPDDCRGADTAMRVTCADVGSFVVSDQLRTDRSMVETLRANCPEFAAVYDGRRVFQSSSERELALASHAAVAGWSTQEIVNLVIADRRENNPEKMAKAMRPDYLRLTLAKAIEHAKRVHALNPTAEEIEAIEYRQAKGEPVGPDERATTLDALSAVFGVKVLGFEQHGRGRQTLYALIVADAESPDGRRMVEIGGGREVLSPASFETALMTELQHVIEGGIARGKWRDQLKRLMRIVEVDEAYDADDRSAAADLIEQYLAKKLTGSTNPITEKSNRDAACAAGAPFVEDGTTHLTVDTLNRWGKLHSGDNWDRKRLVRALRQLGWRRKLFTYRADGHRTTRSYYFRRNERPAAPAARPIESEHGE